MSVTNFTTCCFVPTNIKKNLVRFDRFIDVTLLWADLAVLKSGLPFSRAQRTPCAAIVSVRVSPNGKGKVEQVKCLSRCIISPGELREQVRRDH